MKKLLGIIIPVVLCQILWGQETRVSLYNDYSVKTLVVTIMQGEYLLTGEQKEIEKLGQMDIMYLSLVRDSITLRGPRKEYGQFSNISLTPLDENCIFKVKPVYPSLDDRQYDDGVDFKVDYNRVLMVNKVQEDKYLAGVIEAEGGPAATIEYYKAQAVLCRTYAYKNEKRHIDEGFNLCDGVHCQAYKGRSYQNQEIHEATKATRGLVAMHADTMLISAPFHANCGGETQNSKAIWLSDKPYLAPVTDPYCLNKRNSTWRKEIDKKDWVAYLARKGFNMVNHRDVSFTQPHRKAYYKLGNDSIAFSLVRKDWQLLSAFFSVEDKGVIVVLNGKGYGHGVGMCQIGAMEMSRQGKSFREIIDFYFHDVEVVQHEE